MRHGFVLVTRVGRLVEDERELARLWVPYLEATAASNQATMQQARLQGAPIPPIYSLPLVWYSDPPGVQVLYQVLDVLEQGWGDCKALVCIRMAELAEQGWRASPRVFWRDPQLRVPGEGPRMHAQLRHSKQCGCVLCRNQPREVRQRGFIEDPSKFLGM